MNGGGLSTGSGALAAAAPSSSSGGLVPNTYANAFVKGSPREGMQRIQTRLSKAKILTDELADYFAARRELESSYLKSLQKIAKRSFLSDPSALGPNFLPVYERLVAEIGELASIHGELEKKLEIECEGPMRSASNRGEWGRIKEHDDGLSSTLREINSLESQLAKDQKKNESASSKKAEQTLQKVTETEKALRQTLELWETEAPFAFEAYQRIDAQRLETMKEVITKFETARSDAAQRLMSSTEQSMQVVLNFDPQIDMQEFALKNATTKDSAPSYSRSTTSNPSRTGAALGLTRRGSMGASTLLGRNSSHTSASPAQNNGGFTEFGGMAPSSSASIHSTERNTGLSEQGTPTPSRTLGGSTLKSALTRFGRGRSNKSSNDTSTVYGNLPEGPEGGKSMRPPAAGRGLSTTDDRRSIDSRSDAGTPAAAPAAVATSSFMTPLSPTRLTGNTPTTTASAPQVDAEGFSIPPPDRRPWETGKGLSAMDDDDEERDTLSASGQGKMTGMSIAQKPIAEDADQEQVALERMKSTLLTSRTQGGPQRRNTARRDRRDVRNTTYGSSMNLDDGSGGVPSRASTFGLPQIATTGSPLASPLSTFAGAPGTGSHRTQSIVSSNSMSQLGALETASGLNASITERVNVVFKGRDITRMMVVGEVAVTAKDVASSSEPLHLRIESFEQLEKVAPNPSHLKALDTAGEYSLDLATIVRQTAGTSNSSKAVLLKYQLHIPPSKWAEYAPLNVSAQWRCEDHQTSILINYSANSQARLSSASASSSIKDVALSVDVTSPAVSNVMSKPSAVYSAEQKKLFWKISEAVDMAFSAPNKALARFQVDEKSQPCPIDVRWRISGTTLSTLGLSIVQSAEGLTFGDVSRQLLSGKYTANP